MRTSWRAIVNGKSVMLLLMGLVLTGCPGKKVIKKRAVRRAPVLTPAQLADQQLQRGNSLLQSGRQSGKVDYAGVEKAYKAVLNHKPNHLIANYNLGVIYEEQGKHRNAAVHLVRIANAPEHRQKAALQKKVLMRLAQVYVRMKQFPYAQQTLARYQQLEKKWNKNPVFLQNLATVQVGQKQYSSALKTSRRILALRSDSKAGYRLIARIYFLQRRYESVQTVYEIAAQKGAVSAGLYNICGLSWLKRRNMPKASAFFKAAVKKNPRHFASLMNLGMIAIRYQNKGEAERLMQKATEVKPMSRNAWLSYAVALRLNGKGQRAREVYLSRLLSRNRNDAAAIFNLGILNLRALKQPERARARFRQYIGLMGDRINRQHSVYRLLKRANRDIKVKQMSAPSKSRKKPAKASS